MLPSREDPNSDAEDEKDDEDVEEPEIQDSEILENLPDDTEVSRQCVSLSRSTRTTRI